MVVPTLLLGCAEPAPVRPNLVLLVLDTVRADRLSCYGYERPTTPNLDALCARGIRFDEAWATSSWTVPSHASLFTGLYPLDHGATQENVRLERSLPTLAEILRTTGYAALGVSANPLVSHVTGLDRGFAPFAGTWSDEVGPAGVHPNLAAATQLLAALPPEQPFFLFVNFMEAHSPYLPPEPHRSRFLRADDGDSVLRALARAPHEFYVDRGAVSAEELAALSDLYDGEIAWLDEQVGAFLDQLRRDGHLDDTLLVVTSDHGEAFGEHGHVRHVFSLHAPLVRVPLILVPPGEGRAGERRSEPVSGVDVFATLLAAAGVRPPDASPGRDLLAHPRAVGDVPVFAEYYYPLQALGNLPPGVLAEHAAAFAPFQRRLRSVQLGSHRLIQGSDDRRQLFDLARDPGESADRSGDAALRAHEAQLAERLAAFVARRGEAPLPSAELPGAGGFGELSPDTAEQLRRLGYLH